MKNLDPSYLRYIYDSILSGEVSPENESSLPDGLVGLYEENFPEGMPAAKRQRLLTIFAQWALLRKEVTVEFMAEITATPVDEIRELIGTYSTWFNSPETGKYMLFHERIRSYFLQKLSENKLCQLNERLIIRLQKAIKDQEKDEFEFYALQFLSDHLLIEAFADVEKGNELLVFNKNENNWNRQIKFSNQFKWTENSIKNSIRWTAKFQPEETVMGFLELVELQYKEKNDAENIVALVANNEMDMALKRIDSFAGNDKEGLQRKFTLYMLCLMELTLLDSKDKSFRKSAIEKLLNHLDEKIPVDDSILNWNDFFPSYLVFTMACEWAELAVNYGVVYKRTDNWDSEWIREKGPCKDVEFEVLKQAALCISDESEKSSALKDISTELAKQGHVEEALACARGISDESDKSFALMDISIELAKQGKFEEGLEYASNIIIETCKISAFRIIIKEVVNQRKIESAFEFAPYFDKESDKINTFFEISDALTKQGRIKEAILCISVSEEHVKNQKLQSIAKEMLIEGKFTDSVEFADGISCQYIRCLTFLNISSELARKNLFEDAEIAMRKALACVSLIIEESKSCIALVEISSELAIQEKIKEAFEYCNKISSEYNKSIALKKICVELVKQDKVGEAQHHVLRIHDEFIRLEALHDISIELARIGRIEVAYEWVSNMGEEYHKSMAIAEISKELAKQDRFDEAISAIFLALESALLILNENDKTSAISELTLELTKYGKFEIALRHTSYIKKAADKSKAIYKIACELIKQGMVEEALSCTQSISNDVDKNSAIRDISLEFAKQGKFKDSIKCANELNYDKNSTLFDIATELARQGKIEEAIEFANGLNEDKNSVLRNISLELASQGRIKEAIECANCINYNFILNSNKFLSGNIKEIIGIANSVSHIIDRSSKQIRGKEEDDKEKQESFLEVLKSYERDSTLRDISKEMIKQGKIEESLIFASEISYCKDIILRVITDKLFSQDNVDAVIDLLQDRRFYVDFRKNDLFKDIINKLANHGNLEKAALAICKSLSIVQGYSRLIEKSNILKYVIRNLSKKGKINEFIVCMPYVKDSYWLSKELINTSFELQKQDNIKDAVIVLELTLQSAKGIINLQDKSLALMNVSIEFARQGKFEDAINTALSIDKETERIKSMHDISVEMAKLGRAEEAFKSVIGMKSESEKSHALKTVSIERAKKGKIKEAVEGALVIDSESDKASVLHNIFVEMAEKATIEVVLEIAKGITDDYLRDESLFRLSCQLAKKGKINEALLCVQNINSDYVKSCALCDISRALSIQKKIEDAALVLQDALLFAEKINDINQKRDALKYISYEFAKQGQLDFALVCADITEEYDKNCFLMEISIELAEQGNFEKTLEFVQMINDDGFIIVETLRSISIEFAEKGKFDDAYYYAKSLTHKSEKYKIIWDIIREQTKQCKVEEAFEIVLSLDDECFNFSESSTILMDLSIKLAIQGLLFKSIQCARFISDAYEKSNSLQTISREHTKLGKLEDSAHLIQEALDFAKKVNDMDNKISLLQLISSEFARQGNFKLALECLSDIDDESEKSRILHDISNELSKQGKFKEALEFARGISASKCKSSALMYLLSETAKNGKKLDADQVIMEAITVTREAFKNIINYCHELTSLAINLTKQSNYPHAEQTCLEIPQIAERHSCWKEIAKTLKETHGWEKALQLLEEFKNDEARTFYLKGWAESITLEDMSEELIQKALPALVGDKDSIEALLQLYAIHQLFFEEPSKERIARYKKTLNIQWALDIKAQFPE